MEKKDLESTLPKVSYSFADLASPSTTSMEVEHPTNGSPMGIFIHGHTSDSSAYAEIVKRIQGPQKNESFRVEKDGSREINIDLERVKRAEKVLIETITDITGDPKLKLTPEFRDEMFSKPEYKWILQQWEAHSGIRAAFFPEPKEVPLST